MLNKPVSKNIKTLIRAQFQVILVTVLLSGFFSVSSTAQSDVSADTIEQVHAAVRNWILNKTLDVPASYKSGEFYDFEEIIDLSPEADSAYKVWLDAEFDVLKEFMSDTTGTVVISDSSKQRFETLEKSYNSFEKEHIGYKIKHKFRALNLQGETLFYESEFVMDKNFRMLETSMKERKKSNEKTG